MFADLAVLAISSNVTHILSCSSTHLDDQPSWSIANAATSLTPCNLADEEYDEVDCPGDSEHAMETDNEDGLQLPLKLAKTKTGIICK